jgi:hypothetical protein
MKGSGAVFGALMLFGFGCGDPVHTTDYNGPPVAVIRGTITSLIGLGPGHSAVRLSLQLLNPSNTFFQESLGIRDFQVSGFPAPFEVPLTRWDAKEIDDNAQFFDPKNPEFNFRLYGVVASCFPTEICTQEAAALDDFIAFSSPGDLEGRVLGDASGDVKVPAGFSHVRRPCTASGPGQAVTGPLDESAEFVLSPIAPGTEHLLNDRVQTCAAIPASLTQ